MAALLLQAGMPASNAPNPTTEIVQRYLSAIKEEEGHAQPVSMEVDIDAKLPKLKKHGRLHALKFISKVGQIFYRSPRYEGDNTVKKEVIGRYLQAELQARSELGTSVAITPPNYKFNYKGVTDYAGIPAYVIELTPKKKRAGLFRGESGWTRTPACLCANGASWSKILRCFSRAFISFVTITSATGCRCRGG